MIEIFMVLGYNYSMGKITDIDLELFKKYYLDEKRTQAECAEIFGCSLTLIQRFKFKHSIYRFSKSYSRKMKIDREELERLYIKENHSRRECAAILKCTESSIKRHLYKYGIKKDPYQAAKKRTEYNLAHYGVSCTLCDPKIKAKRDITWIKKYGGNPLTTEEIKQKREATNLKKYGVKNFNRRHLPKETLEIVSSREKMKAFIESSEEKDTFSLAERLGYTHLAMNNLIHQLGLEKYVDWGRGRSSHYERDIKKWLKKQGYLFCNTRSLIPPQEIDLYNEENSLAIEFNGGYWHGLLPKRYHLDKSLACEKKGVRLIHVWEHEWNNPRQQAVYKNIILAALQDKSLKKIYARKCTVEVRSSKEMRDFFERNNLQGFRGGKFAICLIYEGKVVMSYIMGRCHFGKGKYDWEVIRGATELGHYVVGGASRIWKYFVRKYQPRNCVYYVDFNQFNGKSVEKLGFKYLTTRLSFRNYWVKTKKVTNRDPSHHKEIKALIATGEVLPLWNAGVKVYVWGEPNF